VLTATEVAGRDHGHGHRNNLCRASVPISNICWPGSRPSCSSISAELAGCEEELVERPSLCHVVTIASLAGRVAQHGPKGLTHPLAANVPGFDQQVDQPVTLQCHVVAHIRFLIVEPLTGLADLPTTGARLCAVPLARCAG